MSNSNELFLKALEHTLAFEGLYSNDSDDAGGETYRGITVAVARANGYHLPMKDMDTETVQRIYRKLYWDAPKFAKVGVYMPELSCYLFDIGVNCGPATASKMLQTAINMLGERKIEVDGDIGERTLDALWLVPAPRRLAIRQLVGLLHGQRYLDIVKKKPTQAKFLAGWLKRVQVPGNV
jgi:lysozyme family protein